MESSKLSSIKYHKVSVESTWSPQRQHHKILQSPCGVHMESSKLSSIKYH